MSALTFCDEFSCKLLTSNNMISRTMCDVHTRTCKFFEAYKLHLPYGLVQFCCHRKIYEFLLTPNCTQSHGVTYANSINLGFVYWGGGKVLCSLTLCVIIKKNFLISVLVIFVCCAIYCMFTELKLCSFISVW